MASSAAASASAPPAAAARARCVLIIKAAAPHDAYTSSVRRVLRIRPSPAWSTEEDARLARLAEDHGARRWRRVAEDMPGRSAGQCRARWRHHLARDVYHRAFTAGDDDELASLFRLHDGRWREISRAARGRTSRVMRRRWKEIRGTDAILSKLWKPTATSTDFVSGSDSVSPQLPFAADVLRSAGSHHLAAGLTCMPVC
ncbi:hypothetical protein EJB05_50270, partial [Eragrostis curvula]